MAHAFECQNGPPRSLRIKAFRQGIMLDIAKNRNGNAASEKEALEEELAELETKLVELAADETYDDALEEVSMRMSELYEQLEEIELKQKERKMNLLLPTTNPLT